MKKFTTIPTVVFAVKFENTPKALQEIAKMCNVQSVIATRIVEDRFVVTGSTEDKKKFERIIAEEQFIMSDMSVRSAWELKTHFIEVKE